ncbi:MAG: hypothetical protein IPL08_10505 [Saprospiraceae bacterium]|nr:hypothetical protein [Saprospiraceae bacterium]
MKNWIGKPNQTDAGNAYSIYRQALAHDYNTAFEQWQIAFKLAPATDAEKEIITTQMESLCISICLPMSLMRK